MKIYAGYVNDAKIRWNSTSGGVVTGLLSGLLEQGVYKRAFVVRHDKFDGGQAMLTSVKTQAELFAAAKSKYVPVAASSVVAAVQEKSISHSIVVCTPCQLKAIRNAMAMAGVDDDDVLFIGLFCERMFNYEVYGHYEREYGWFDEFRFRDKEPAGWPGNTSLISGGERRVVDRKVRMSLKPVYPVHRCDVCSDKLNVSADISVGDCYVSGFSRPDGNCGVSSIVVRTQKGMAALDRCRENLVLESHPYELIEHSQHCVEKERLDSRHFNVCIDIASLFNRGDWLMYCAILEQVRGWIPNAVIYVPARAYKKNPAVYQNDKVLPLVDPAGIDLLLYAPGFKFSDGFGAKTEEFLAEEEAYFASFTKPRRKVVLLPQAFGPFELESSRRRIRAVVKYADLVYAREQASYDMLVSVVGRAERIRLAPDFTCVYHAATGAASFDARDYVVVVPNKQMIRKTGADEASNYVDFSIGLVSALLSRGEKVVLLNHEGPEDRELIDMFNAKAGMRCKIVDNVPGGVCKSVISGAKLVVTSRFHGLVSGLTEGVPCLCTSWSHKYRLLVEELGVPESLLDLSDVGCAIEKVLGALKRPDAYIASESARRELRHRVYAMWREVFSVSPTWAVFSRPLSAETLSTCLRPSNELQLEAKVAKRDERIAKLVALAEHQKQRIADRDERIAAEKAKVARREELISALRGQRDELQSKVEILRSERAELEERMSALRGQRDELRSKVEILRSERAGREERMSALRGQRDEAQNKAEKFRKECNEARVRIKQLHAELVVCNAKLRSLGELFEKGVGQ